MDFCPECGSPVNGEVNETSEELNLSDYTAQSEKPVENHHHLVA